MPKLLFSRSFCVSQVLGWYLLADFHYDYHACLGGRGVYHCVADVLVRLRVVAVLEYRVAVAAADCRVAVAIGRFRVVAALEYRVADVAADYRVAGVAADCRVADVVRVAGVAAHLWADLLGALRHIARRPFRPRCLFSFSDGGFLLSSQKHP